MINIEDGKEYKNEFYGSILVNVLSGTPFMEFSQDDFLNSTTLDLTVSPTYPTAIVDLPLCNYKFTLSGAVVQVSPIK